LTGQTVQQWIEHAKIHIHVPLVEFYYHDDTPDATDDHEEWPEKYRYPYPYIGLLQRTMGQHNTIEYSDNLTLPSASRVRIAARATNMEIPPKISLVRRRAISYRTNMREKISTNLDN
jgi:hypothetical protein